MNHMPKVTIAYALLLILVGCFAYFVWAQQSSMTALIPAYAGAIFLVGGLLAARDFYRMHVMHVMVLLALVLLFGTAGSIGKMPALLRGEEVLRPLAVKVQFATAALTSLYLALAIRSFIVARLARKNPD